MSILIKGMEMPKDDCEAYRQIIITNNLVDGKIQMLAHDANTNEFIGEVVELPPHGRLIDADALSKSFEKTANYYYEHNSEVSSSFWGGGEICTEWYAVEDLLENAPTIIPAEEGE